MKIKNKIFYQFPVVLASPLSISGGNSDVTDHDILLNDDGKPFITGSSLVGAFRNFWDNKNLWGYAEEENGKLSRIMVSDIIFENANISIRDGIGLDENKVTKHSAKYDYQIIETGAVGTLKLEVTLYKGDKETEQSTDRYISHLIYAMHMGLIRFGYKKTRGLGKIRLSDEDLKYNYKSFDFAEVKVNDYLKFYVKPQFDDKILKVPEIESNDIIINTLLELKGALSIRTYSDKPEEPDFQQITLKNNTPIIPGSTWNGAIRSRAFSILDEICPKLKEELNYVWGIEGIDENNKEIYRASDVIISESEIRGSHMIRMTRNKINRFDASTVDTALYTERSCFGGETTLRIGIRKEKNLWVAGLLLIVLEDLCNGLLSVGGQTAVGRGIFEGKLNLKEEDRNAYMNALKKKTEEVSVNENN